MRLPLPVPDPAVILQGAFVALQGLGIFAGKLIHDADVIEGGGYPLAIVEFLADR